MTKQLLPERLIVAREALGINKAEAARRLNLSKIGYCRYEYGERIPSPQTVELVAQCFNTSVDFLTGETTDISPDCIVIKKDSSPELYELVKNLSDSDSEMYKRIFSYYIKLKK